MEIRFPLILDGATGTELQKRGYTGDVSAEQWVLAHPDSILSIQRDYVAAGSQVLYTPTFGGNAVKLAEQTARDKGGCVMLGSIIHNAHVVQGLAALGARQVDDPAQVQAGDTVIIRSHGEKKQVYQQLEAAGASIVDATCPNVRRIQRLVAQAEEQGRIRR